MSHMWLFYPTWDWYVPRETCLSHVRLVCPTWDWSVICEIGLSHVRLVCPTLDWSVPRETGLSVPHETGLSVPHETALSHMRLLPMYFVKPNGLCILFAFLLSWDWFVLLGTELWDGTGTGTRLGLDHRLRQCRTVFMSKKLAKKWTKIAYWVYKPLFHFNFQVWQCSSVSSTAAL